MAETWATSGLDLHLDVTTARPRAELEHALRAAVSSGRLRAGATLPSSRTLARDLGIARNTVAEAYGQLVAEGWLVARQGSGTQVAERAVPVSSPELRTVAAHAAVRYDLRPGSPDLSSFPRTAWAAAVRRALSAAPSEAFGYGDPRGRPELRTALADYLARARGVRASSEHIVVCSGFTQALTLLCRALRVGGAHAMAVEAYSQPTYRKIVDASGLAVRLMPVDLDGASVDAAPDVEALLLTPAHQFPLGAVLSPARRAHAVTQAVNHGSLIIEDDYDGEFRYDRQPVGALQAHAPESVVYAGTASKTLAPGLRLGWLVLPARLVDDVVAVKELADRNSSALDQLTLAEFIRSGQYDRHIRSRRLAYRRRRDALLAALATRVPRADVVGVAAGLHVLVRIPYGQSEADVVARATAHGLAVEGLGSYAAADADQPPSLVVGYATPPDHAFSGALAALCATLATSSAPRTSARR